MKHLQIKEHPKGFIPLCFIEIITGFNYFGFIATFVIFLLDVHQKTISIYMAFGVLLSISYITPVLGGIVSDKFLGSSKTLLFGIIIQIFCFLWLGISPGQGVILAAILIAISTGFMKSAVSKRLSEIYSNDQFDLKDQAFKYIYAVFNLGAIAGPIMYGVLFKYHHYQYTFLISSVLSIFSLFFLKYFSQIKITLNFIWILTLTLVASWIISTIFTIKYSIEILVFITVIITFSWLVKYIIRLQKSLQKIVLFIIILNVYNMIFFVAEFQFGALLPIFAKEHLQLTILNWNIPAGALASLLPFFVAFGVFIANPITRKLNDKDRFTSLNISTTLTLIIASISFCLFSLISILVHHEIGGSLLIVLILLLAYFLLGLGEIIIAPMVLSAITEYIPEKQVTTFIGIYYLFISIGGLLAGMYANYVSPTAGKASDYTYSFFTLSLLCFFTAIFTIAIQICFKKKMKNLLRNSNTTS